MAIEGKRGRNKRIRLVQAGEKKRKKTDDPAERAKSGRTPIKSDRGKGPTLRGAGIFNFIEPDSFSTGREKWNTEGPFLGERINRRHANDKVPP